MIPPPPIPGNPLVIADPCEFDSAPGIRTLGEYEDGELEQVFATWEG